MAQIIALAMQVQRPAQGFSTDTPDSTESTLSVAAIWAPPVTPFERILHGSSLSVRNVWSNNIDLRHTRQQDAQLRNEVARLREEEASFSEDAAQGRRLQKLLQFKQQYVTTTVPAQVIGTSGSDRSRLILIDKGASDGLKPEQAVITPDGIVGKLRDVFPHSAQVLLISDPTSGAGVILASTRIRGIVRGTANGQLLINDLTSDSRIKVGDHVVTSGGDKVFPRGLPVGEITSIAPDPQHQPYTAITVQPYANLSRLDRSPRHHRDRQRDACKPPSRTLRRPKPPSRNPSAPPTSSPSACPACNRIPPIPTTPPLTTMLAESLAFPTLACPGPSRRCIRTAIVQEQRLPPTTSSPAHRPPHLQP